MAYFDDQLEARKLEALRQDLLDKIYAGAFGGGFSAMLVDGNTVRRAGPKELEEIAQRYGLC